MVMEPKDPVDPKPKVLPKWALVIALVVFSVLQERQMWPLDPDVPGHADLLQQAFYLRAMIIAAIVAALAGQTPPVINGMRRVGAGIRNIAGRFTV